VPATLQRPKEDCLPPCPQSHGWTGHAYTADCKLLASILNENVPAVQAVVLEGGWPTVRANDYSPLRDAAALVIACDGNNLLRSESNWKALDEIAKKGVGIAFLHYALDPGKEYGKHLLDWDRRLLRAVLVGEPVVAGRIQDPAPSSNHAGRPAVPRLR